MGEKKEVEDGMNQGSKVDGDEEQKRKGKEKRARMKENEEG